MQLSNVQAKYQLTDLERTKLIPPKVKYENNQLPRELAKELANMHPQSNFLKPGMDIDEAIAELNIQRRSFRIANN